MKFTGICLNTNDVPGLVRFYQSVLGAEAEGDSRHAIIKTEGSGMAIFSLEGMEEMAPGSTAGMGAGAVTLMFEVEDADREYERLLALGVEIIKPPETYPWGARSAWFRDPDGNIVDFYAPVRPPE